MSKLPTREEMVAEILARPNLDPMIREMFEQLNRNAIKATERLFKAMAEPEANPPTHVQLTRKHGFTTEDDERASTDADDTPADARPTTSNIADGCAGSSASRSRFVLRSSCEGGRAHRCRRP